MIISRIFFELSKNHISGARDGQHRRELENDNEREGSPSPGSGNKRQKVASGSGGSCSSKESTLGGLGHRESEVGPGGLGEKLPLPANLAMGKNRASLLDNAPNYFYPKQISSAKNNFLKIYLLSFLFYRSWTKQRRY